MTVLLPDYLDYHHQDYFQTITKNVLLTSAVKYIAANTLVF